MVATKATKESTDTARSTSYLNIQLEIDSEGKLITKLYDERDDLNSLIVIFSIYVQQLHMEYISLS